jgi:hypothetical protein
MNMRSHNRAFHRRRSPASTGLLIAASVLGVTATVHAQTRI